MINVPRQLGANPAWEPSPALRDWMQKVSTAINGAVSLTAHGTLLIPPLATADRPTSPAEGEMYYDITVDRIYYYSAGNWRQVSFV